MNILQFFRRQNEQPAQHPSNEDRSSMAELPSVRERFEGELRLLLKSPHRKEPDRQIIREYFGD